jgi:hypothetical protein
MGGSSDYWREDILQNIHLTDIQAYILKVAIIVKLEGYLCGSNVDGNTSRWVPWRVL